MKIRKWDILFFIIGLIVVAVLYLAPSQTTPRLPLDETHKTLTDEKTCRNCHGEGTNMPMPPNHPNKERCLLCHKRK